jgi:hypothetical protein
VGALLALLIVAILFPVGWLGTLRPGIDNFGEAFMTARAHAIAHAVLFGVLALFLYVNFPRIRTEPVLFIGIVLMLAVGQELGQLLYKQRPLAFDEYRDVAIDLFAATGMWMAARTIDWMRRSTAARR